MTYKERKVLKNQKKTYARNVIKKPEIKIQQPKLSFWYKLKELIKQAI